MKQLLLSFLFLSLLSCGATSKSQVTLKFEKEFDLDIPEPSGIAVYKNHLYILSDKNGTIYQTDFKGESIRKILTSYSDLEGVTLSPTGELYVVNEKKRTIIHLNAEGEALNKLKIKGKQENKNSGLEGITWSSKRNSMFVVNEKSPRQLLELDIEGRILNKIKMKLVDDISGVYYNDTSGILWLVSDQSKEIIRMYPEGKIIQKIAIPVKKAEGITIYKNNVFVVSDSEEKLYQFKSSN